MGDLLQNVENVYKKWEAKSAPDFSRSRRGIHKNRFSGGTHYQENTFHHQSSNKYSRPRERYKRYQRSPHFSVPKYESLAQFKMAPTVATENKSRPFMGLACAKCLPMSRASIQDPSVFVLSVCNVLRIPFIPRKLSSASSNIYQAIGILGKCPRLLYPDVSAKVLTCDRVSSAVQTAVEEDQKDLEDCKCICIDTLKAEFIHKVKKTVDHMKSSVSVTFMRFTALFLHFTLNKILNGILVHKGHIEILQTISQENIPFIYLPVHRSHFDYILVSFILYMNSLRVPLVAAGDNLYIPLFGCIMKFLGAFFIRRRLDCDENKKDYIYRAVLHSYMVECLKAGHSIEFFIEGGRSRSGKPQMPKAGLLSIVVDSVLEGSIEDAYITPVSISYEKIIEGNFIAEQLGHSKEKESFFSTLCSVWKIMHLNFGNIRLNFCQPFSLKEFLQSHNLNFVKPPNSDTPPDSPPSLSDVGDLVGGDMKKRHVRSVINNLAEHIVYDAMFATSVMSTQLLAFLFVTQFRKGATQQQLQNGMDWLRGELLNKKRDTGFSGESLPIIKRAVDFLGKDLITSEIIEMEWTSSDLENNNVKVIIYKPVVKLPHVLELQYYANSVVPIFLLDSLVVNALYALVDVEICHFRHCDSKLYFSRDSLIDKAVELNNLLQFEFIAVPPCVDIALSFSEVIDELIEKECLIVPGVGVLTGSRNIELSRKPNPLSFESDDDEDLPCLREQQLKIDLKEESIAHLEFLRNVLSPYIESYWLAACSLLHLIDEVKEENLFIQEMQMTAQEKLYRGLLAYEESFSADTFKNSLKLFEHWHVIEYYIQDGVKIIYLDESFNCCERINDVIAQVEEFRK